jgi:antitoxin ParD1/3/4
MTTIRKSLTITASQEQWFKLQIQQGGFANDSEYLRHLIRMDEERTRNFLPTKADIQDGYDSGVIDRVRTVEEIMESALIRQADREK